MVRAPFVDENGVKKGAWSQEEDDKLKAYITKYGHWNWRELPRFAGLQRCGKSCRLRWMNYLRPGVKHGNYSKQEEEMITELHEKFGNKWSKIAAKLPGRTDNEVKNYWHTHLKRQTRDNERESSSSGSEAKQCSSFNQNEDYMILEDNSAIDMPCDLILESSPLSPISSSINVEFPILTCDSSATSSNWNIPQDTSPSIFEPFENFSDEFWSQPFVPEHHNQSRLTNPHDEILCSSYFPDYEDGTDLFYQVMNELS